MYNDQLQKSRRQELRTNLTKAEHILWQKLRNRQINNLKFYRQYGIGPYILDFFCPQIRLAIELDGEQHKEEKEYDEERDSFLKDKDIKVLRFWNSKVLSGMEDILKMIKEGVKL